MNMKMIGLKNDRGESFVAILIAITVVSVALLFGLTSLQNFVTVNRKILAPPAICREVAENVMNTIRSNGVQSHGLYSPIDDTSIDLRQLAESQSRYRPTGRRASENREVGVILESRWPERERVVNWRPTTSIREEPRYRTNSPLLIQGAVNALLSIYNQNGNAACRAQEGFPIDFRGPLGPLVADAVVDNHDLNVSIKITPYEIQSGRVQSCLPRPLRLRPPALEDPPPAQKVGIFDYSRFRSDLGLEAEIFVSVRGRVEDDRGRRPAEIKCSLKDRFQFNRFESRPLVPTVAQSGGTTTFTLDSASRSPGTQMVCREQYVILNDEGRVRRSSNGWSTWLPCNQIQICGNRGNQLSVNHASGEIRMAHTIPSRCNSDLEVQAVDAAGNLSDIRPFTRGGSTTSNPPPYRPQSRDRNSGYAVGGLEFNSRAAAQTAAAMMGVPANSIRSIENPRMPRDLEVGSMASAIGGIQTAVTNNRNAVNAMGALPDRLPASASSSSHSANYSSLSTQAASASRAASAAQAAARSAAEAASRVASTSTGLGPAGEGARLNAESMARHAQDLADAATRRAAQLAAEAEAARLAMEAARRREEEARRRAQERRESRSGP